MKKLLIALCLLPLAVMGQEIKFDTQDYKSVGVYDRWEHSPFRTGELAGNCEVVDNPDLTNNPNKKVLGFQRSRLASNIFGARIDLKKPIALGPAGKVVHVLINRPMEGRVMLVGLGKRRDRAGQSQEVEQFWIKSTTPVPAGQWADAVFPIKSAEGVDIYSLVVVPHAESPHEMKQDAVVYIDDINIPEFKEIPTYKRMCVCILKNDHTCKYMGFSQTKRERDMRKEVMDKYNFYKHGKLC